MSDDIRRTLPKMDLLLAHPLLTQAGAELPHALLLAAARATLDALRAALERGACTAPPEQDVLAAEVIARARGLLAPHLRPVVNATGVPLHTNLGRAPLSNAAAHAALEAGLGYCNLEYDTQRGARDSRHAHVEGLLRDLTGAEAALAVNNNAAAVLLMLAALCRGRRVAVSRGELVEIGGGFRVPDIMAESGALLAEVGTTNKTRLADYEGAAPDALLKVHTSNYAIVGFTEETPPHALSTLAQRLDIPFLYDLGSGALSDEYLPALPPGPTVRAALSAGADVVCFSGDKLLGGPQAGLLVGKARYLDVLRRHPLARCARIDKLSLAALEATLLLCRDPAQAVESIPTLSMLAAQSPALEARAHTLARLLEALPERCFSVSVLPVEGQVGGGSMPSVRLPSFAVALSPTTGTAESLEAALRAHRPSVVALLRQGRVLLDVRTLTPPDLDHIAAALSPPSPPLQRGAGGEAD